MKNIPQSLFEKISQHRESLDYADYMYESDKVFYFGINGHVYGYVPDGEPGVFESYVKTITDPTAMMAYLVENAVLVDYEEKDFDPLMESLYVGKREQLTEQYDDLQVKPGCMESEDEEVPEEPKDNESEDEFPEDGEESEGEPEEEEESEYSQGYGQGYTDGFEDAATGKESKIETEPEVPEEGEEEFEAPDDETGIENEFETPVEEARKKPRTGTCKHCGQSIRIANGGWVHDDPDEDPSAEDYGWAKCLPDEDGSWEYAEPLEEEEAVKESLCYEAEDTDDEDESEAGDITPEEVLGSIESDMRDELETLPDDEEGEEEEELSEFDLGFRDGYEDGYADGQYINQGEDSEFGDEESDEEESEDEESETDESEPKEECIVKEDLEDEPVTEADAIEAFCDELECVEDEIEASWEDDLGNWHFVIDNSEYEVTPELEVVPITVGH